MCPTRVPPPYRGQGPTTLSGFWEDKHIGSLDFKGLEKYQYRKLLFSYLLMSQEVVINITFYKLFNMSIIDSLCLLVNPNSEPIYQFLLWSGVLITSNNIIST